MVSMDRFPSGGWQLEDYEGFDAWTRSLKLLGNSSRVSAVVSFIFRLRIRFERLSTPVSPDESESSESSDDDDKPSTAPAFAAGTAALGAIRAGGRAGGTIVTEIDGVEFCDNDPRVSLPSL